MLLLVAVALGGPDPALAQERPLLSPLTGGVARAAWPPAPWVSGLLPAQTLPTTRFRRVEVDGESAVRIEAPASYGNLVHPLPSGPTHGLLSWRWRVDELNTRADLTRREGDDTSLKVCLLFDMPLERVPFIERQLLRLARSRTGQTLPAATVCYLWDARLPAGSRVENVYSRRVRYLVLRSPPAPMRQWLAERREVGADFLALFGDESPGAVPPLQAVAIGADNDNTGGTSLAYLADLRLEAGP